MFGESESESPRVPSPWDSLISSPPSPRKQSPSPLAVELIPRLVPEADDGNVEYKLQLLNPSAARFARLVTQMKWRLLEGGGQAYYELGVADSGDLIGLPRDELEQSLETLEMMAGEIGASVIVVKEIEVPAVMATLAKRSGEWASVAGRRARQLEKEGTPSSFSPTEGGYSTMTETEAESTDADADADEEDLSRTVVLPRREDSGSAIFSMDTEPDDSDEQQLAPAQSRFCIDLEISSVFKPRPMKARNPHETHLTGGKSKRAKKHKPLNVDQDSAQKMDKAQHRRQGRDRRREDKRKALEASASQAIEKVEISSEADTLVKCLETLHVEVVEATVHLQDSANPEVEDIDEDDDVFASPKTTLPSFPTFSVELNTESHLDVDAVAIANALGAAGEPRLIVEALVVRKMSLEEAFLDFGGFSLT